MAPHPHDTFYPRGKDMEGTVSNENARTYTFGLSENKMKSAAKL